MKKESRKFLTSKGWSTLAVGNVGKLRAIKKVITFYDKTQ